MLLLNNADVASVLTMATTMEALEKACRELTDKQAVCRPRIDIQIPKAKGLGREIPHGVVTPRYW